MRYLNLIAVKVLQKVTKNLRCMIGSIFIILFLVFLANITLNKTMNISIQTLVPLIIFGSVGGALFYSDMRASRRKARLLICGERIYGVVTDVKKRKYTKIHTTITHFGNEDVIFPYEIIYKYEVNGKQFIGKSDFIWDRPNVRRGDAIEVYFDTHKPQLSVIKY